MSSVAKIATAREAEARLRESERQKAEIAALRPKTNWLVAQVEKIVAENHLSQKVRDALGPQ